MVEVIEKVVMMEIAYRVEMFLCVFFRMVRDIWSSDGVGSDTGNSSRPCGRHGQRW